MINTDSKALPPSTHSAPQTGGFGTPGDSLNAAAGPAPRLDDLAKAVAMAREAAKRISSQFGTALDHASWLKVSRAFERVVVPHEKRRRGRKPDAAITAAVADYEAGMRGVDLYRKHIPGYSGMSYYRRLAKQRNLNEAIRTRRRRDRHSDQEQSTLEIG